MLSYKRLNLDLKTHLGWKWKMGKDTLSANSNQKTVEEAILLIDKIDLESETVTRG